MTDLSWLPDLILLSDFHGRINLYLDEVYNIFKNDFVISRPTLNSLPVFIGIDPKEDGKEWTYWHVTHKGEDGGAEQDRIFAPRRCERIAWIRAIIENVTDPAIKIWNYKEGNGKIRTYIWLEDYDYVVVLEKKSRKQNIYFYFLVTAFYIDGNSTQRKLHNKYDKREP